MAQGTIRLGDTVRLRRGVVHNCPAGREDNATAKVSCLMSPAYPGGVMLERDLRGCLYWNVADLERVAA